MRTLYVIAPLVLSVGLATYSPPSSAAIDSQCRLFPEFNLWLGHGAFWEPADTVLYEFYLVGTQFVVPGATLGPYYQQGSSVGPPYYQGLALTQQVSSVVYGVSYLYTVNTETGQAFIGYQDDCTATFT